MTEKEIIIKNKLRVFRKKHDLSQEELADKLGISRQSIIALEHGKYMPSLPLAVSMCNLFDSTFEDIFEFEHQIKKVFENINSNFGKEISMPSEMSPWRPFREAISLRDAMDRLFEDSVITPKTVGGMPRIDIKETKDAVIVKAELPGMTEEEVNIEIMDNVMTISGEKVEEKVEESEGYHYKESHSGAFQRSFSLPAEVKAEKADAEMKNGVLIITVPKIEPKKAKKIAIKAKTKK